MICLNNDWEGPSIRFVSNSPTPYTKKNAHQPETDPIHPIHLIPGFQ